MTNAGFFTRDYKRETRLQTFAYLTQIFATLFPTACFSTLQFKLLAIHKSLQPKGGPKRAGTLIICPLVALTQWQSEIGKFSTANSLSVCCYHGPNRAKLITPEILQKFDVVLTSYQVLQKDFGKMTSPNKVRKANIRMRKYYDRRQNT